MIQKDFTGDGTEDQDGHGTHCAGTIFGRDVDGLRIGIARGIKKALIGKVIGKDGGASPDIVTPSNGPSRIAPTSFDSLGIDFLVRSRLLAERVPEAAATSLL